MEGQCQGQRCVRVVIFTLICPHVHKQFKGNSAHQSHYYTVPKMFFLLLTLLLCALTTEARDNEVCDEATYNGVNACLKKRGCHHQHDRYAMRYRGYWFGEATNGQTGEVEIKCHLLRHYCKPRLGTKRVKSDLNSRKSKLKPRKTKLCPHNRKGSRDCLTLKHYYASVTECEQQTAEIKRT